MAYRGRQATIVCGQGTFTRRDNQANIAVENLVQARNIRAHGSLWRRAPGMEQFDSNGISGTPAILGAIAYSPDTTTQRIITACSDGSIYRENNGDLDAATMASGLTFTEPISFVEAGVESLGDDKHLVLFSGGVAPRAITADGSTMPALSNPSGDWTGSTQPFGGVYHDSRVVAFLGHSLYFGNLTNQLDFTTSSPPIIEVAPGRGERIVAAFSFLPQQLYVWKYPLGIYRVDTTDVTASAVAVDTIKTDIGGAGPNAVARVKDDVWYIANTGHIHSMRATETAEDTADSDITASLELEDWIRDNVDRDNLKFARLIYDESRQEVWAMYRGKTGTYNNIGIVFDVSNPQNIQAFVEDRGDYFESMFLYRESDGQFEVYTGGTGGHIYEQNAQDRAIAGTTAYTSVFEHPATDLAYIDPSLASREKRFDYLEFLVKATGNYDLDLDIFIDGVLTTSTTVNLGSPIAVFDTAVFDTDRFAGGEVTSHKVKIYGRGRRIGIRGTMTTLSEDFAIAEMIIHFREQGIDGTK